MHCCRQLPKNPCIKTVSYLAICFALCCSCSQTPQVETSDCPCPKNLQRDLYFQTIQPNPRSSLGAVCQICQSSIAQSRCPVCSAGSPAQALCTLAGCSLPRSCSTLPAFLSVPACRQPLSTTCCNICSVTRHTNFNRRPVAKDCQAGQLHVIMAP